MRATLTKSVAMIAACLFWSVPLMSQTPRMQHTRLRVLTAIPRAAGRTARNMVTWKDPLAAAQEWGIFAAVAADLAFSKAVLNREPGAQEESPLWPKRPSTLCYVLEGTAGAILEASYEQWTHEQIDGQPSYGVKWLPLAISGGLHGWAADHEAAELARYEARKRLPAHN